MERVGGGGVGIVDYMILEFYRVGLGLGYCNLYFRLFKFIL